MFQRSADRGRFPEEISKGCFELFARESIHIFLPLYHYRTRDLSNWL
jgi:hypothetical protein